MRMLFGALAAASVIGLAGAAYAADASGKIKTLDAKKMSLTLANGSSYDVAKSVDMSKLKVGEKVTVTYAKSGKMMDATAIKPAA